MKNGTFSQLLLLNITFEINLARIENVDPNHVSCTGRQGMLRRYACKQRRWNPCLCTTCFLTCLTCYTGSKCTRTKTCEPAGQHRSHSPPLCCTGRFSQGQIRNNWFFQRFRVEYSFVTQQVMKLSTRRCYCFTDSNVLPLLLFYILCFSWF